MQTIRGSEIDGVAGRFPLKRGCFDADHLCLAPFTPDTVTISLKSGPTVSLSVVS